MHNFTDSNIEELIQVMALIDRHYVSYLIVCV